MSEAEKRAPVLRFLGFVEDWEQRKVGEYLKESRIPGTDGSVARKLTVKLWRKGVIPKEESYKGSTATNYFVRKSGQFIYGKLDFLNQAFGIVPHHLDGYESTLDSPAFDIVPTMNSNFFLEYVSREQFYLYQGTLANGSRKAKRIHTETFFEMPINVPTSEEQNEIGNFFKLIEDTIALHQRKLTLLKQLKQTYLQVMFPQIDETIPALRFAGFSQPWEQRKLEDNKDVRDGTHDSPKYHQEGHPLVTSKNLNDYGLDLSDVSLISDSDFEAINKRSKVDNGDILFGMIGTIGNPVIVDRSDFAIKNVALIKEGGNIPNRFLIQLLKSPIFDKYIRSENAGNTQKFLGLSKIREFTFFTPVIGEQIKIGTFFKQFDDTIALHQERIDNIKYLKSTLLNKMFI